MGYTENVTLTI